MDAHFTIYYLKQKLIELKNIIKFCPFESIDSKMMIFILKNVIKKCLQYLLKFSSIFLNESKKIEDL